MKERPILFSGPMVRAILEGRKTQTRRVIKLPSAPNHLGKWESFEFDPAGLTDGYGRPCTIPRQEGIHHTRTGQSYLCPHGPGDHLWVRETFGLQGELPYYRADGEILEYFKKQGHKWKPSIFMPRWASRITLEVVNVRVERLQDISEEDSRAEGVTEIGMIERKGENSLYFSGYADLWDEINGKKYPWSSNPWVWVIEFKKI